MNSDDLIAEIVMKWEEAFDHGTDLAADELCVDHPELVEAVARRITALKEMSWVKDAGAGSASHFERPMPKTLGGRYRIDGLIAEGGMGVVYRGYDPELERPVAIKVPLPAEGTSEAFITEARRAAKLRHPGIVSVHDVGRDGDQCFIVADLIEGTNLAERIDEGRLPWREAVRLISEVADALGFAHEQGFVHRDIKPANILLDTQGRPHLTDFGIAATLDEVQHTSGVQSGTLPFMAPEQLAGEMQLIDARTDLYSLGVVLYETLTGKPPYQARTPTALREQILFRQTATVRSHFNDIPLSVEVVVVRCLAKHPADRFGSAAELASALRATLSNTPWVNRRLLLVTFGMIAILIAGGISWAIWPTRTEPVVSSSSALTDPPVPKPFVADGVMHFDGQTRIVTSLVRFAPCTLEAWVWPEEYTMTGTQMVIGGDIPTKYGIGLGITGVVPCAEIIEGIVRAPKSIPLKQWSHLAAVFTETETRLYMNGQLVATGLATKTEGETTFVIGNVGLDNPIDYFKGRVRAVRISKHERYTVEFTPEMRLTPDGQTVLLYYGESVDSTNVNDRSGNGHTGRIERSAK
jgi:eukaryotic-like serine/threonine-protein kinase